MLWLYQPAELVDPRADQCLVLKRARVGWALPEKSLSSRYSGVSITDGRLVAPARVSMAQGSPATSRSSGCVDRAYCLRYGKLGSTGFRLSRLSYLSPHFEVSPKALLALLALGCMWGTSFLFIKVVVEETSALELVEGRLLFGALVANAVLWARKANVRWAPSLWLKVAVWSALGLVLPFLLIAWAEEHIASGTASVLNSTMPLWTALFSSAILAEEKFTPERAVGLVAGFVGVVILTGGDVYDIADPGVVGQLAVVAAAACYGAAAVFARTLLRRQDPLLLSGAQLTLGPLLVLPVLLAVRGAPDYSLSVEAWLSLTTLGALGTGAAIITFVWLLDNVGSVRASLVTYIVPVVGLLLGWALLDESIGVNTVLGAAMIIAGVTAVIRGQVPTSQRLPAATEDTGKHDSK